jgi:hypothetical protein
VIAGQMEFRKGLGRVLAGPGETVIVSPGTYHRFANVGDEPARVRVRVLPALRMEQLLKTVVALAHKGRTVTSGMPKPLDLALLIREFGDEVGAPIAPGLIRALMAPLAWAGARHGLDLRDRADERPIPSAPGHARPREARRPGSRPPPPGPWHPAHEAPQERVSRRGGPRGECLLMRGRIWVAGAAAHERQDYEPQEQRWPRP